MQPNLAPGTLIGGRLEVERVAGCGGMGTVYRAHDIRTGECVAVKVLQRAITSTQESQRARRFAREVRILSDFRHPGIVSYVTSGKLPDGLPYLVMEWLEGEDLAQRLRRGALTVVECRKLLDRVGEALAYAHQQGIVHRDIKPSNLFLVNGQFERVVVLDFGVAHYDATVAHSALTMAGAVVGTLEYMAPEQARAQPDVGPAADIYSLGRVAYQALVGRPKNPVGHVAAALARVMFEESPALSELRPGVPISMSMLVSRMLAKHPLAIACA